MKNLKLRHWILIMFIAFTLGCIGAIIVENAKPLFVTYSAVTLCIYKIYIILKNKSNEKIK